MRRWPGPIQLYRESFQKLDWKIVAEKHSMQNYTMQDILTSIRNLFYDVSINYASSVITN